MAAIMAESGAPDKFSSYTVSVLYPALQISLVISEGIFSSILKFISQLTGASFLRALDRLHKPKLHRYVLEAATDSYSEFPFVNSLLKDCQEYS